MNFLLKYYQLKPNNQRQEKFRLGNNIKYQQFRLLQLQSNKICSILSNKEKYDRRRSASLTLKPRKLLKGNITIS